MTPLTFLTAVSILCRIASGTYDGWHGGMSSGGYGGHGGHGWHEKIIVKHIPKHIQIPKAVPIPKLIPVPKYLKFLKPLAIAKPVPIPHVVPVIKHFQKPFPVLKGVPFHFPIPLPKLVKLPFPIKLPKPYVVHVPKPYAVPKKFPVAVPVHIPKPYVVPILKSVPVPVPKKVHKIINIVKEVPEYVKKPVPVYVEEKPYKKEYYNPDVGGTYKGKGTSLYGNSAASFIAAHTGGQSGYGQAYGGGGIHAGGQGGYGQTYGGGGFGGHGLSSSFYTQALQGNNIGYGLHSIPTAAAYGTHGYHGLQSLSGLDNYSGYDGRNTDFNKQVPDGTDHGHSDYKESGVHSGPTYQESDSGGGGGGEGGEGYHGQEGQAHNSEPNSSPAYIGVSVTHYNQDGHGSEYSGPEENQEHSNNNEGTKYDSQANEPSSGSGYGNHLGDFSSANNYASHVGQGGGIGYGSHTSDFSSTHNYASHEGQSDGNEPGGGYGNQGESAGYQGQSHSIRYFHRGEPKAYPYQTGGNGYNIGQSDGYSGYSHSQIGEGGGGGGGNYGNQNQAIGLRLAIYHPNQVGNLYHGQLGQLAQQSGYSNQGHETYGNSQAGYSDQESSSLYGSHQNAYQGQGSESSSERYSGQNEEYGAQSGGAKYDSQSANYEGKSSDNNDYRNEEAPLQYQSHQSNGVDYSQSQPGPVYVSAYNSQGGSAYYQQTNNEENLQGQESEVTGQYGAYPSDKDSTSDSTGQAEVEQSDDSQIQPTANGSGYSSQVVKQGGSWHIVPRS